MESGWFARRTSSIFTNPLRLTLLNRLQIGDDGADLIAREYKFGHVRMAGDDALAQCLFERLDRIAFPEGAERRRLRVRALAGAGGRMATGAIPVHEGLAAPQRGRVLGGCGRYRNAEQQSQ